MNTTAKVTRWTATIALALASFGAAAQGLDDKALVWVENESFGFEACGAPASDRAAEALALLRERAAGDIDAALRAGGVVLDSQQYMTLTPLSGSLACAGPGSQVTFRVAAVDRQSGKFWSADMPVRSDAPAADSATLGQLGNELARYFKGVQYKAAML